MIDKDLKDEVFCLVVDASNIQCTCQEGNKDCDCDIQANIITDNIIALFIERVSTGKKK